MIKTILLIGIAIQYVVGSPTHYVDQKIYPELYSGYFEGDIVLVPGQRVGVKDKNKQWPESIVPIEINGNFTDDEKNVLSNAVNEYYVKTCVRFEPRRLDDVDYVSIENNKAGCFSYLGRKGGKQIVNFAPSCFYNDGTTIHELLHAIGFFHEHSRPDRDEYVDIIKENIEPKSLFNFNKLNPQNVQTFGVEYDYGSVMHYTRYAFSKNGEATIVPKDPTAEIGQRNGLSVKDALKINIMYNCTKQLEEYFANIN